MAELLVAGFLLAHGLVHAAIYGLPTQADAPFDPGRSWALSAAGLAADSAKHTSIALAVVTAALFAFAALGVVVDAAWWPTWAVVASATAASFKVLYFTPWLVFGIGLDVAVVAAVAAEWPPSVF